MPAAAVIAFLANPKDVELLAPLAAIEDAARQLDRQRIVVNATSPSKIDAAFTNILQQGARAVNAILALNCMWSGQKLGTAVRTSKREGVIPPWQGDGAAAIGSRRSVNCRLALSTAVPAE